MIQPRVMVDWPLVKDLHQRRGRLLGAEAVRHNGCDLGLLFEVDLEGLPGPMWVPKHHLRLLKGEHA